VKIGLVFTTALSRPRRLAYQILAKGKSLAACPNRRSWARGAPPSLALLISWSARIKAWGLTED
jgi:hypothetical protein